VLATALGGARRRAATLAVATAAASTAIVAAVSLAVEPRFAADLLGEAGTPGSPGHWRYILWRRWTIGRDLPLLAVVGFGFWAIRSRRDLPMLLPAAALLIGLAVASASRGGGGPAGAGGWPEAAFAIAAT